jgi:MoaA/NifB/PqqE/SkfB family radical SAM enzyme
MRTSMPRFDLTNPPERLQMLIVETTTLCSLKCAGCLRTRSKVIGKWLDRHMTAVRFQKIVDHSPPSESICVQGIGEPTLNPDFLEIIRIARASGKYNSIFFSTHGLARDVAYYRRLIEAGVTHFRISVDSLVDENAQRLRAGTDVDKLRRRITEFAEHRLPFGVTITISKHNLPEVPGLLQIFNEIGQVHHFQVGMHNFIYNDEGNEGAPDYSSWVLDFADIQHIQECLPQWSSRFSNLNLEYVEYYDGASDAEVGICDAPWTQAWVGVDGLWGICCFYPNPSVLGFTRIEEIPFEQAWRSKKAQDVLQKYSIASPSFCDRCPKNCGRLSSAAAQTMN